MKILNKTAHFFISGFIFGILYLVTNIFPKVQFGMTSLEIMALYALFFAIITFRSVKGSVYQKYAGQRQKMYNDKGMVISNNPEIAPVYKNPLDLRKYIIERNNRNLFIAGRSGSGKTTLMRYIIGLFPESNKIIFSFKAHDDYLKLGIPILRISEYPANPFTDKEAFCQAFLVANPISFQGITSSSATSLLRSLLAKNKSNTWDELENSIITEREETTDRITMSAYTYILQKLQDLKLASTAQQIDMNQSIVLDFSGLNESAKSFYSELYLRQAWKTIEATKPEPMKYILIIDEAHRLLKSDATIFNDVARLIRSKGALWCGTQNYSDLLDSVRNQFAMHFVFSTKSERDIKALAAINDLFPFIATELEDQHFTDAAMLKLHKSIPIYTTDISKFKDVEPVYLKPAIIEVRKERIGVIDATETVLKIIEEEASWANDIARKIAIQFNTNIDTAKLSVTNALHRLHKEGFIARESLKIKGNDIILYYRKDSSLSGLHKFMENKVKRHLDMMNIAYELPNGREGEPDINTANFDIEIETGLKNNLKSFSERLEGKSKKTYVILPNNSESERYRKVISYSNVVIMTLNDYLVSETKHS